MNKSELVKNVAKRTGLTQTQAELVLSSMTATITDALKSGDSVRISGFGTFERRTRAARSGVHPRTGETISIPEVLTPVFKAGTALREAVRAG